MIVMKNKNNIMEYFVFENNANEEFKIFLDEENRYCLNIRIDGELKACFILDDEDIDSLGTWYKKAEKYRNE